MKIRLLTSAAPLFLAACAATQPEPVHDLTFTLQVDSSATTVVANINGRRMLGELPLTCGVPANMTQITREHVGPVSREIGLGESNVVAGGTPFRCGASIVEGRNAACECPSGDVVALKALQRR